MNVNIGIVEYSRVETKSRSPAPNKAQRRVCAFFHHVADLSRQHDRALARITQRLDVQNLASHRCPRQTGYHAGLARRKPRFTDVARRPKNRLHHLRLDMNFRALLAFREQRCDRAANSADPPLEFAHTGFTRVILDQTCARVVIDATLLALRPTAIDAITPGKTATPRVGKMGTASGMRGRSLALMPVTHGLLRRKYRWLRNSWRILIKHGCEAAP